MGASTGYLSESARARNWPVDIVVLRSQNNQAILEVVPGWLVYSMYVDIAEEA